MNKLESRIASVKIIPSGGGRFEVTVNKRLVYSKLETGRHADSGEVLELVIREDG